jgi:hypothetical protein
MSKGTSPEEEDTMASEMSPLCKRSARKWYAALAADGLWRIRDGEGHQLRRRFFTADAAEAYTWQLAPC